MFAGTGSQLMQTGDYAQTPLAMLQECNRDVMPTSAYSLDGLGQTPSTDFR